MLFECLINKVGRQLRLKSLHNLKALARKDEGLNFSLNFANIKLMKISRKAEKCLKILISPKQGEKINILIDPDAVCSNEKANIVLVSEPQGQAIKLADTFFLINSPGEYEIKGIFIRGIEVNLNNKNGMIANTIYTIEASRMRICYLGNLGQKEFPPEQLERIGSVDALIFPVSGGLSPKEIRKIISQIEPKVVIPLEQKNKKVELKDFLREMGVKEMEERKYIVLKKQDLKEEEMKVIALPL